MSVSLKETISKGMITSKCHYKFEGEFVCEYECVSFPDFGSVSDTGFFTFVKFFKKFDYRKPLFC